ncbi:MAG: isoleucine--tRNA ligase [Desulfurococcales archaeon]|nr:isoleucine--tRNA ligase [Desulfurococcales archaeon]
MPPVSQRLSREKYDQRRIEEWVMSFWDNNRVYEKVREASRRRPRKFYFLDGPPYASAKSIHVGTAWNKILKDTILRYYRMRGYNVWDQPGYDTHGLPIEVQVEKSLGIRNKKEIMEKVGVSEFIEKCRSFVRENMEAMTRQFKELGAFMDWKRPYITYDNSYIESGWWLIKRAHEKGLLYRGLKVLHWCPRCETTLADYEVSEYRLLEDPSIYVKFPVEGEDKTFFLVWTTTPWTLPANAFLMVHPDIYYVKVRVGDETLILAEPRLEEVMEEAGVRDYSVVERFKGRELEGARYRHPLEDLVPAQAELRRYHKVVLAPEAVTAREGTGIVHSAPGHGDVDFEINNRLVGAPPKSLVGDNGLMTAESGAYSGLYFREEANRRIVEDLEKRGAIFHKSTLRHRYPVCWRCKTPLLLRSMGQWFIAVSKLKDEMKREAEKIRWTPSWAKSRFMNILNNLQDWVISRQRFWGIPLPIWVCARCGEIRVIGSLDELRSEGVEPPHDLHRPWIDQVVLKCRRCSADMRRVPDVIDVWFDSGIAFYASLGYPRSKNAWERLKPVDLIVEGHDQIRGWFFSLLRSGMIGFGEAPYQRVLVHGFALDEMGREMHKSLGNFVSLEDLITRYPRDVARMWILQNTVWEDLRFSWKGLEQMTRFFNIVWNVYSFASTYMGLDGFNPEVTPLERVREELSIEDRWMLSRLNTLIKEYHRAFGELRIHDAARMVKDFMVEDVSHWYLRLVRPRVWEERDTPEKRAAYAVLYEVLKKWLLLASPLIPFLAEYIYQSMFRAAERNTPESIHLSELPEPAESLIDRSLEEDMEVARRVVEGVLAARNTVGIKLRKPVKRIIVAPRRGDLGRSVERMKRIIALMGNAKNVEVVGAEFFEHARAYSIEPDVGAIGREFKSLTPAVLSHLRSNEKRIASEIIEKGRAVLEVEGRRLEVDTRHVKIRAEYPEWLKVVEMEDFIVGLDTRLSREEIVEGYAREIVRRIQAMRKDLQLPVEANINVWIQGDKELVSAVRELEGYVSRETRAVRIHVDKPPSSAYVKEWEVDSKRVILAISRAP